MPLPLISAVFPTVLSAIFIEADVFRTGWHGDRVCFVPCCNPSNPERALSACFESSFDCDHGEEEFVWVILEEYKFMVKIEGASGLVQSFDYNANRRYLRRVSPTSMQRIHQEKATEVSAPARTADLKIEGASGLVQSFDYNANRRYLRRVSPTSMQRIH